MPTDKSLKCEVCGKGPFKSLGGLLGHKAGKHGVRKPHPIVGLKARLDTLEHELSGAVGMIRALQGRSLPLMLREPGPGAELKDGELAVPVVSGKVFIHEHGTGSHEHRSTGLHMHFQGPKREIVQIKPGQRIDYEKVRLS